MLEPLDFIRYIGKNYRCLREDYNLIPLVISFFIIPFVFAILLIAFMTEDSISNILSNSLEFFSIIIGFLINVLVLVLTKKLTYEDKDLNNKVRQLKKHLGYNLINSILFGIILVVLILFYGHYPILISFKYFTLDVATLITLFLSIHFIALLLNIIRKFGVYVETINENKG